MNKNVCSVLGKIEKNGRCVEPKNWIVRNKTFIFGGGEIWQPKCNVTREEILKSVDAVKEPKEFLPGGKCFGKNVGKVFSEECTTQLKDGIAFVESEDNLKIGIGHGGLLGGIDKELTFIPVSESVCQKAEKLDRRRKELDDWELSEQIPKGIDVSNSEKKELNECRVWKEKIEKIDAPIRNELKNCVDEKNIGIGAISTKCKPECNLSVFPNQSDNINNLIEKGITDKDTIKRELKGWGKKISDIKKVYYDTEVPFILETKDKERFVIAPQLTKKSEYCNQIEMFLRQKIRNEAERINKKIENLVATNIKQGS